jgi:4-hydroxy-tetrahydrodipicolinate synthase
VIELADDLLRGSYPPIITPFTASGELDLETYGALIEHQVASGSHGIVVNGTTAEPSVLSVDERKQLAEHGMEAAGGRVPVMVATGSQSLAETLELTEHADHIGADALLVVTPYYLRPPQRGLIEYFTQVGRRTNKPVLLYHIPGRAAVDVTIDTLVAIADRLPHFVGMKHAATDLGLVTEALARLGPEFRIFVGLEELSFPMLAIGACGMVNAVANLAPEQVARLYQAIAAAELPEGRRLHFELFELNRAVFFETNPIPLKYMMRRRGLIQANHHRLPMVPATRELEARLDAVLERAGLL